MKIISLFLFLVFDIFSLNNLIFEFLDRQNRLKQLIIDIWGCICLYFDIWCIKFILHAHRWIIVQARGIHLVDAQNVSIYIHLSILRIFDNWRFIQLVVVGCQAVVIVVWTRKDFTRYIIYWFVILLMKMLFITFDGVCLCINFFLLRLKLLVNFDFEVEIIIFDSCISPGLQRLHFFFHHFFNCILYNIS